MVLSLPKIFLAICTFCDLFISHSLFLMFSIACLINQVLSLALSDYYLPRLLPVHPSKHLPLISNLLLVYTSPSMVLPRILLARVSPTLSGPFSVPQCSCVTHSVSTNPHQPSRLLYAKSSTCLQRVAMVFELQISGGRLLQQSLGIKS